FQAEDGIRDFHVTGVQTCALPILKNLSNIPATETAKYNMKPAKFRREYETVFPKTARTPQNVSLLRYTDVLMMYAEAENELNGQIGRASCSEREERGGDGERRRNQ